MTHNIWMAHMIWFDEEWSFERSVVSHGLAKNKQSTLFFFIKYRIRIKYLDVIVEKIAITLSVSQSNQVAMG